MVLSRLTKITGPGVATDTNWVGNNADFTGITTTATSFNIGVTTIHSTLIESHNIVSTGVITATGGSFSGNVTAVDGTFSGNVSIAGTLTYEDVTNIDSVGIITAPVVDVDDFLDVGSNIKLGNAGVITATSFVGSGAALTGIDATSIKDSGGNVKIQAQASGAVYTGIHTFNSDLDVDGHTNLDNVSVAGVTTMSGNLTITNTAPKLFLTDSDSNSDYSLWNSNGNFRIYDETNAQQRMVLASDGTFDFNSPVDLNFGVDVSGNANISGDIDVDGHTNLDNVSIAGVVTATSLDVSTDLDVDGHTNLDNVSVAGVTTMSGNLTISNTAPVIKLVDTDNNSDFSIYGAAGVFNIYDETNTGSRLTIASDGTITAVQGLVCSSTLTISDSIIHTGDTDTKIRFPAADTISMETAGNEVLSMNLDGLVTGGQTNPTSSDNGNIYIKNGSSIGGVSHAVNYVSNAVFNGAWKYITSSVGATRIVVNQNGFKFDTAGSGTAGNDITFAERFIIEANGYTKIGSGTPKAQLDIKQQGNSWEDALLIQHDNANTGWNLHAERTNSALWIGYNSNTASALTDQTATQVLHLNSNRTTSLVYSSNSYELTIGGISGGPTLWLRDSTTSGTSRIMFGSSDGALDGAIYYKTDSNYLAFYTNGTEHIRIDQPGNLSPVSDASRDLGTSSLRWRNVYTTDLQLSNENTGGNEVDGTEGNWTLQEGESDVYMINRKTGKKYKMMLQEVS